MNWKTLKSQILMQAGFFRLRVDECELPDGRVMPRYYVLEFHDWVNVVPVTDDGQMILVEQHRHAAAADFLEIPGGSTDSGESALEAGRRELREETGFEAREWIDCGYHYPNPALQSNRMHTFLALGCRKVAEPDLDPFEDLKVKTLPVPEVLRKMYEGEMKHSLIAASLMISVKHLKARALA